MKVIHIVVRVGENELWRKYSSDTSPEVLGEEIAEIIEKLKEEDNK